MNLYDITTRLTQLGYAEPELTAIVKYLSNEEDIAAILTYFPDANSYVDFEGSDSCSWNWNDTDCAGWDGYSHRCACGNRRVYWSVKGNWAGGVAY